MSQRPRSVGSQSSCWASLPCLILSAFIAGPHLRRSSSLRGSARAGAATFAVTTLASAAAVAVTAAAPAAAAARLGRRGPGVLSISNAVGVRVAPPRSAPAQARPGPPPPRWRRPRQPAVPRGRLACMVTLKIDQIQGDQFAFVQRTKNESVLGAPASVKGATQPSSWGLPAGRETAIRHRPRPRGAPLPGASARADFSQSSRGSTRGAVSWCYVRPFRALPKP